MLVHLVQTTTRDGIRLDGIYLAPEVILAPAIDAVVCVHGTGSNFYGSTLFDALATRLLTMGIGVLRINTRGHDLISTAALARGGGQRLGAAYETFDDCRHDLDAWIDWLKHHGRSRIGLMGHSSGAVKCLYTQAYEPNPAVAAIIALSPPRLSHAWFLQSDRAAEFRNTFAQAQALVAAGESQHLLDVSVPLPFVITAAGYVEKYGPDERYNYLTFLDRLTCPTLVTLGEIETTAHMAFREVVPAIHQAAPRVQVETIGGADHFYTGVRDRLIACIESWLHKRSEPEARP
jgi:pimeloyl-ACP methyl ester carboxylesterase